jgi:hypothetical protein
MVDDETIEAEHGASARLFDLRYLIGALLALYGVVLIIVGLLDDQAELDKAAGIRINLWMGIGMLVFGALFLLWARWRPLKVEGPSAAAVAEETAGPRAH